MSVVPVETQGIPPVGHSLQTSTSTSSSSSQQTLNQTEQSLLSAQISQIAEGLGQQTYNWALSQLPNDQQVTDEAVNNYMNSANLDMAQAQNVANQYQDVYVPEEQQLANEAGSYSSAARAQVNAGQAAANSIQGSQAGINQSMSALQAYGVNPSAGAFGAELASQKVAAGAAAAGAGTEASLQTQAAGRSLLQSSLSSGTSAAANESSAVSGLGNAASTATSGAENAQLANTSTGATALDSANPFLQTAQNLTTPQTTTASTSNSSSSSYGTNFTQANQGAWQTNPLPAGEQTNQATGVGTTLPLTARGGAIDDDTPTQGGAIDSSMSPSAGAITDDVNAHVNTNEFVIPRDVALWKGQEFFQKLIQQSRQALQQAPAKPTRGAPAYSRNAPQFVSRPQQQMASGGSKQPPCAIEGMPSGANSCIPDAGEGGPNIARGGPIALQPSRPYRDKWREHAHQQGAIPA